jgi:UDP:flavonoid glycosyltransferase YjiC (YdhE family)
MQSAASLAEVATSDTVRVAVLCFLPDTGHVTQLLQLAQRIASRSGAAVSCFLPARFAEIVAQFGFEFHGFHFIRQGPAASLFDALSRRSIFHNGFCDDEELRDLYWAPLHEAASREIEALGAALQRLRPTVILADTHVFAAHYRHITAAFGARLVLNRASGTLVSRRHPFVRAYGLTGTPELLQRLVEAAGYVYGRLRSRWRRLRHARRMRLTQACEALLTQRVAEVFGPCDTTHVDVITTSTGVCAIEAEIVADGSNPRAREVLLAPADQAPARLSQDLLEWLKGQRQGRIVYVGFGTMVRPTRRMLLGLWQGLRDANVSVLWALPVSQREPLAGKEPSENFRFEDFAPQAALLMSGFINCFITHAGPGGVQEALLGGVPMLCIPFLWDQPYTASLVVRMGAGIRGSRRRLTPRQVCTDVLTLLEDRCYAARAAAIGARFRALRETPAQTQWMDALFPSAPATATRAGLLRPRF